MNKVSPKILPIMECLCKCFKKKRITDEGGNGTREYDWWLTAKKFMSQSDPEFMKEILR